MLRYSSGLTLTTTTTAAATSTSSRNGDAEEGAPVKRKVSRAGVCVFTSAASRPGLGADSVRRMWPTFAGGKGERERL